MLTAIEEAREKPHHQNGSEFPVLSSPLACLSGFCFWLQLYAYVIYEYTKYPRDVAKGDYEKSIRHVGPSSWIRCFGTCPESALIPDHESPGKSRGYH
jgi:hypothetical protein